MQSNGPLPQINCIKVVGRSRDIWICEWERGGRRVGIRLGHPGTVVGNQIWACTGVGDLLALSRTWLVMGSIRVGGRDPRIHQHLPHSCLLPLVSHKAHPFSPTQNHQPTLLRATSHPLTRYGHNDSTAVFDLHGVGLCARHSMQIWDRKSVV